MMNRSVDKRWMTSAEVMRYLGVSKWWLKRLRDSGQIHYYQLDRMIWFEKKDIDALITKAKIV